VGDRECWAVLSAEDPLVANATQPKCPALAGVAIDVQNDQLVWRVATRGAHGVRVARAGADWFCVRAGRGAGGDIRRRDGCSWVCAAEPSESVSIGCQNGCRHGLDGLRFSKDGWVTRREQALAQLRVARDKAATPHD
jgi:hypothetical protein